MTTYLVRTEIRLLFREPLVLVVSLMFPIMLMVLLLASFSGDNDPVFVGMGGTQFYVTAYVPAAVAAMGFMGTPTHLASYRSSGVLRRFRAAGLSAGALALSQIVVMIVLAIVGATAMLILAYTGFDLTAPESIGGVVLGFLMGALSFAGIGALLGSLLPSARVAQGLGLLLFFGTFFLVGGGPPQGVLPDGLVTIAHWTPTGLLVDAFRSPWVGNGLDMTAMVTLAIIAVASYALAVRRLSATNQ